ncbi:MAG: hypothetical protein IH957_12155 [Chloroflexi bacterium]|nr:hypothetical protein [Chloroflexota bacterium]
MAFDLAETLVRLLPRAISWAEDRSAEICADGKPLNSGGLALARAVGVASPEYIRVKVVERLPLPEDVELRDAALLTGLLGPGMVGMTFGYGIYLCRGHITNRLLSHECRHVYQYESSGSIGAYLPVYLDQIATFGYEEAPLEADARSHEREGA